VDPLDYTDVTPDGYKIEYNYGLSHTHNVAERRTLMLNSACQVELVGQTIRTLRFHINEKATNNTFKSSRDSRKVCNPRKR